MSESPTSSQLTWWQRLLPFTRPKLRQVASFRHERQLNQDLGEIFTPVARVDFWSPSFNDWHQVVSIVDTGADLTILPSYLVSLMGIRYSKQNELSTIGLGGQVSIYLAPQVKIRIGSAWRTIPVGITNQTIPPLLGRQDCLNTFEVLIDHQRKTVFSSY